MEDAFHVLHSLMAICTYMIDLYAADDHVVQVVLLGPVNSHLPGMIGHPASANWYGATHNMDVNNATCHSSHCSWFIYIASIYTKQVKPSKQALERGILTCPTLKIHMCLPGMPISMETGLRRYGPSGTLLKMIT